MGLQNYGVKISLFIFIFIFEKLLHNCQSFDLLINPTNELLATHIFTIFGEQSSNKIMNPQDYLPHSLTFFLNKNYFE